ncbi:MAG: TonB-dependent receptor [Gammaproteobacteria bacterium]|nr:TonB-dependent receptor [Gammaproteobacteria bacterium]MDH3362246.1 TonB-dependent receptor [Gammaproteobacteria bacterium]MDH3480276.1 TonB-dependent receptor [Gammaproteobacteria bacterium]
MSRLLLLLAATVVPPMAAADDNEIEEVLVTATRRVISSEDVSSGLTLITREQIRTQKLVTDSLASNVGVFLQQTTPGQGAAIIRGLKGSSILHLVDGMRLNNAIFRSAPTQYFSLVPVSAVERVEVLRGTPTSLYGNDAVGGVVQLVTSVPSFDSPEIRSRGEAFAAFDTAELGKTARARLDFGNSAFASSFGAEYLKTGDRRTGSGARVGPSGYESRAARIVFSATPASDRSWLLDMHYLEQPETPRADELVPGFAQVEPSSSEFFFAPNRRVFVHGKYTKTDGPAGLDWTTDVAWQRIDDDRVTRDFEATERRREANSSDLLGLTLSGSRITQGGSWIVGAEFYHDEVRSKRFEEVLTTGAIREVPSRFPDGSTVTQAALYANVQHRLSNRNNVNGGIRVSNDDVSLPDTAVSAAADIDGTDVGGDIGWIFDATPRWQVLTNLGLGFRAPNVFDLGTLGNRPGNRFNVPNTTLGSERVVQADVGVRHRSERVAFDLMVYALRYDDRITSVGTGDLRSDGRDIVQSVNAAESLIRGVEAGLDVRPSDDISIRAVLNYTWGEQQVAGDATEPAGRIPPFNGSVILSYDAGGDYRLESWLRFAGDQERLSARDIGDSRIDPQGTPGWAVIGARIEKSFAGDWLLSVSLDNLLDKRYRVHGSGLDAPGRNLIVGVRRSW